MGMPPDVGFAFIQGSFPAGRPLRYQHPGQDTHNNRNTRKHEYNLFLTPAAHLKVMMDGRHLEQALTVGGLEVGHLQHHRDGLDEVDEADRGMSSSG